jgi:hypothetical protein
MSNMDNKELIKQIEEAFKDEKYPGDTHIVYDNTGYHLECIEIRDAFAGRSWHGLHENFLFEQRESIIFFSKEGFKYYLPSYMTVAINKFREMDTLPDTVIHKLTLPAEADDILMATEIKQYQLDKRFPSVDFNDILQNSLKMKNKSIHDFIEYMNVFGKEQSIVVKSFLEYMIRYSDDLIYDPRMAIERYWFQF